MSKVKVAAVQMRCAPTVEENLQHAEALVREAAANGAQIIRISASSVAMISINMHCLRKKILRCRWASVWQRS